jgi:hypothetical protein
MVAGSSLLLGRLLPLRRPVGQHTLGLVMAFGAGALIGAVVYEFVEEACRIAGGSGAVALGLFAGAFAFHLGELAIDRFGGEGRKSAAGSQDAGSFPATVLGTVLDGIPGPILGTFAVIDVFAPSWAWSWFVALTTTTIGSALALTGGIVLFHYQSQQAEQKLEQKLVTRVAVESKKNLELLEDPRDGQPPVVVMLDSDALRDLIRSNLLEPESAKIAMDREGTIKAHNRLVEALLSLRLSPLSSQELKANIASDLSRRQENLKDDFRTMVRSIREKGFEVLD